MKIKKTLVKRDYYIKGDTEVRNIYRVTITKDKKRISFSFGDSIANTQEGRKLDNYSILACCKLDYYSAKEYYPTFEDFANSFGYDIEDKKNQKIYKECIKQADKLHKIFTLEDIEKLPD